MRETSRSSGFAGRVQDASRSKKTPDVIEKIKALMKHETAGDPMTGLKWTRRTTEKIAEELRDIGITVCAKPVCKLLRQMGYALCVNHKKLTASSPMDRDEQFAYIANRRESFAQRRNC